MFSKTLILKILIFFNRSLHRQLDDDDNGDIDLSESDDVRLQNVLFFKITNSVSFSFFAKSSSTRAATRRDTELFTLTTICT
jgi:hypothetical protein